MPASVAANATAARTPNTRQVTVRPRPADHGPGHHDDAERGERGPLDAERGRHAGSDVDDALGGRDPRPPRAGRQEGGRHHEDQSKQEGHGRDRRPRRPGHREPDQDRGRAADAEPGHGRAPPAGQRVGRGRARQRQPAERDGVGGVDRRGANSGGTSPTPPGWPLQIEVSQLYGANATVATAGNTTTTRATAPGTAASAPPARTRFWSTVERHRNHRGRDGEQRRRGVDVDRLADGHRDRGPDDGPGQRGREGGPAQRRRLQQHHRHQHQADRGHGRPSGPPRDYVYGGQRAADRRRHGEQGGQQPGRRQRDRPAPPRSSVIALRERRWNTAASASPSTTMPPSTSVVSPGRAVAVRTASRGEDRPPEPRVGWRCARSGSPCQADQHGRAGQRDHGRGPPGEPERPGGGQDRQPRRRPPRSAGSTVE